MKGFFKFLGAVAALFAAVLGALAIFDKFINKKEIVEDYFDADLDDNSVEVPETEE